MRISKQSTFTLSKTFQILMPVLAKKNALHMYAV
jgi:hypothetical protein